MAAGTVILLLGLGLVILLLLAITRFDPTPYSDDGVMQTGNKVVDFFTLFRRIATPAGSGLPGHRRRRTEEWVVFYRFDMTDGRSPYAALLRLRPGDRRHLSLPPAAARRTTSAKRRFLKLEDLVKLARQADPGGVCLWPSTDLTIFRTSQFVAVGVSPRRTARYQVIGSFRGDGGVGFNPSNKQSSCSTGRLRSEPTRR